MDRIQLLYVLFICVSVSAVFIIGIVSTRPPKNSAVNIVFLPIGRETTDIELIAMEILSYAEESIAKTVAVVYDMGADDEQLMIFDKVIGKCIDYVVLSPDGNPQGIILISF